MGYLAIAALIAIVLAGGGGYFKGRTDGRETAEARAIVEQRRAEQQVETLKAKLATEAENKLIDMGAAADAATEKERSAARSRQQRAIRDVASNPIYADPRCALPADGLRNVNAARANSLLSPGDPEEILGRGSSVPEAATAPGRAVGDGIPSAAVGRNDVLPVPSQSGNAGGAIPVPSGVLPQAHSKPKPIGRDK